MESMLDGDGVGDGVHFGHMPRTATIRKFIKRQHGTEPNKLVSRQLPDPSQLPLPLLLVSSSSSGAELASSMVIRHAANG